MTAPQILVVDDEADIRTLIEEILSEEGYRVETAGDASEARRQLGATKPDLVLLDIWMPDTDGITLLGEWSRGGDLSCPVVIMSGHGTVETAVEATRLGAVDFVEKPLSLQKLLRTVEKALETRAVPVARGLFPGVAGPMGKSEKIRALRERAREIAAHPAPVLIVGEPGSGRESIARFMHAAGDRADQPFLRIVAAAVPAENAAALLFGREDSGHSEPGLLEQAGDGVLFIEDVQDLCDEGQRLLAGALEQGSYAPIGTASEQAVACRVMASMTPGGDGHLEVAALRAELVQRLGILQLRVPALREYPEDVSVLLRQFVDRLVESEGLPYRRFSVAAQNRLRNYPWPGNVEELAQLVRRLLLAGGDDDIGLEELERVLEAPAASGADQPLVKQDLLALPLREAREQFERAYLTQQLSLCGGKVGQLAKRVGMERTHLYRKLRALGIDFRQTGED
jgi:DNA-binding NtrC family response regulator